MGYVIVNELWCYIRMGSMLEEMLHLLFDDNGAIHKVYIAR